MNNLIFIEGVSGVGKTTTAKLLCNELRRLGYKARFHLEGDRDNPLDPFNGTFPPAISLTSFSQIYSLLWQSCTVSHPERDTVLVFDGTLLHHQINDLIRCFNADNEVILGHIISLLSIIKNHKPIIFYLSSSDVGQCLCRARISRNQSVPSDGTIKYWVNRKQVDLYILDKLSICSQIVNIDNGWSDIIENMVKTFKEGKD